MHGLVLGKFWPPTAGHAHLIATAADGCDRLSVLVMAARWEDLALATRVRWLRETFAHRPHVRILGIHDDVRVDYDDPEVWDQHMALVALAVAEPVDVVFTSEAYGGELARRLGALEVCVDLDRDAVPVSGTAARANPAAVWAHLLPPVRGWLARRVVVVGAESTGTTTLARALAARYGTRWVPEYGRAYTQAKIVAAGSLDAVAWERWDFEAIAACQTADEDQAARDGGPVVFADTDAFATAVWHERYTGSWDPAIAGPLPPRDLYLLTEAADVPFEQDGIRDGEHLRTWMTERFRALLTAGDVPWLALAGPPAVRLALAAAAVDALLARPVWPDRVGR